MYATEFIQSRKGQFFRTICVIMMCANILTLCYIAYFYYRQLKTHANMFSLSLVTLITVAIIMGTALYIVLIMATTDSENPQDNRAYNFVFGACSKNLTILSGF